ncbi:MAG: RodZ domain-containing protein [Alphaproteobacteria bacterium]
MMHDKEDNEPNLEFGGAFGPGPRETVADLLRRAREDFGQDLRGVADILRIRPAYLEAIESGEFDLLPGTTYAVGFLRTYAEYLGLDGEDMVERFKAETQAAAHHSELIFPEPVAEGRIPGGAIILVSVALLAVAYGGWFYLSQQGRTVADLIPAWPTDTQSADTGAASSGDSQAVTEPATETANETAEDTDIIAPATTPATTPATSATEAQASTAEVESAAPEVTPSSETSAPPMPAPMVEAPAQDDPVQTAAIPEPQAEPTPEPSLVSAPEEVVVPTATTDSGEHAPITPQPVAESQAPAGEPTTLASLIDQTLAIPAPPSTPETIIIPDDRSPRVYGGSNDGSRIVIRAVQDSWVQVRDSQDAILLTRVLRAGDSYRVPNVTGLTLLTGNAGGIELEVDGIRLPPAGPPGAVRRSIGLDPTQLLSGTTAYR